MDNLLAHHQISGVLDQNNSREPEHIPWWLWINVLSLDAPLLAVLWQAALAKSHRIALPVGCYLSLALTVWIIYVFDRVMDGVGKMPSNLRTARHLFYQRHQRVCLFFVLPAAVFALGWTALHDIPFGLLIRGLEFGFLVSMYLIHYTIRNTYPGLYRLGTALSVLGMLVVLLFIPVPRPLRALLGAVLGAMVAASFVRIDKSAMRLLPKEIICGVLFAVGCSLAVNYYTIDTLASPLVATETLLLSVLAALNCIGIGCYEQAHDSLNDPNAITQTWPQLARFYPSMILGLIVVTAGSLKHDLTFELSLYTWTILISALLLGVIHFCSKRLKPEVLHVLVDAVMLTPIAMLLVH